MRLIVDCEFYAARHMSKAAAISDTHADSNFLDGQAAPSKVYQRLILG